MDSEQTTDTNRVHYEAVVESYQERLHTVLRGFHTGPEFLELWVPDEDDVLALLNMVEAAQTAGLSSLTVVLGPKTAERLDWNRLEARLGSFGELARKETAEGVEIEVRLGATPASPIPAPSALRRSRPRAARPEVDSAGAPSGQRAEVHAVYEKALKDAAGSTTHEGRLEPEDGQVTIEATHDGTTLMVAVDTQSHVIARAAHSGAKDESSRGCFELLCRTMKGKPLLECADHGVIRLEHALRDPLMARPVAGVVLANNASPIFQGPVALLHSLLSNYREKTGYDETENRYAPGLSQSWMALDEEQRLAKLRATLAELCEERGIDANDVVVQGIRNGAKVCLAFADSCNAAVRQRYLVDLEAAFQHRLEPALVFELEAKEDLSQIRRL